MNRKIFYLTALTLFVATLLGAHPPTEPPKAMVTIKGGCFMMGSDLGPKDQTPAHSICLSDFFMDIYEVNQKDFKAVMATNPSKFKNDKNPVDSVTWTDADAYCKKIGKRLPTEAEWEFAAREGGKDIAYPGFDSKDKLNDFSWNYFNSHNKETHTPGMKKPNAIGLYDMAGNVFEWVSDWHSDNYYKKSIKVDPRGPSKGTFKVIRGGSWCSDDIEDMKTRTRLKKKSTRANNESGFRCVMDSNSK